VLRAVGGQGLVVGGKLGHGGASGAELTFT
jgi:hypothetical protein